MQKKNGPRVQIWIQRLVLLFLGMFAAFLIAELSFRIFQIQTRPSGKVFRELDNRTRLDTYPSNPRGYFRVDLRNETGAGHLKDLLNRGNATREDILRTPYAVLIKRNSKEARNPEFPDQKDAGTLRIIVVGDSMTEGEGVYEEDTYVRQLDRLFRADANLPRIEIINFGHRGHDIWQIYDKFKKKVLGWKPDLVLYVFTLNDTHLTPAMRESTNFINDLGLLRPEQFSQTKPLKRFLNQSRVGELINFGLARGKSTKASIRWYQEMTSAKNEPAWSKTQELIGEMSRLASERDIRLSAAILPLMYKLNDHYPFREYHQKLAQVFTLNGIPALDLFPFFKGQDAMRLVVHPVDFHPNEIGHQIIAEALYPFLSKQVTELSKTPVKRS